MRIYFNSDASVSDSMISHLSLLLNADYINQSDKDNCADQIVYDAKTYIQTNKPDLVVLGFPNWNKEFRFDKKSPQRQQYYQEHITTDDTFLSALAKHYNNVIYNLHSELFCLGIPHVFFNCVNSLRCDRDMITFDWAEFYIKPYQMTFNYIDWCRYEYFDSHLDEKANQAWADLLYKHIQQHNLLTKDDHGSLYNLGRQRRRHYGPRVGEWDEEFL